MEQLGVPYYVGSFPKLSENFILNEINELYNRRHNIVVFAQNDPEENITHREYEDIAVPVYYADASYTNFPQLLSKKPAQMALSHAIDEVFKHFSPKCTGHTLDTNVESEHVDNLIPESVYVYHTCADSSKIQAETDWQPVVGLREKTKQVCARYKDDG